MKTILLACLLVWQLPAVAALRVFACEPEWAALVGELAGAEAEVFSAVTAFQDVHYIQARPSLIAQVRRADLVVCTGAGLESGWLPVLLKRAGNPAVLPGTSGYFMAADQVELLGAQADVDRAMGDVHPQGNPHLQLDPANYPPIAQALGKRLEQLHSAGAAEIAARTADFLQRWREAQRDWTVRAAPLAGMPVVVYHDAWAYLNRWLGLRQQATLEPKPGVPPGSRHLAEVLSMMQQQPARAILRAPYQDTRAVDWLHKHTGIPSLTLPYTVGGTQHADSLFTLFDDTLDRLLGVAP